MILGLCFLLLALGYLLYARWVDRVFQPDPDRPTPALAAPDGVDTLPMPTWKVFLVQLLNIAGIGPVFGPILGALYGPVALLWIVIGTIFAGGVHDYFSGMLSVRHGGASLPEVVGAFLGRTARLLMRVFSVLLLVLVGVVFVISPAGMLHNLTGLDRTLLVLLIFAYYLLATVLPIDKIIGRFYPLFGALLLLSSVGVLAGLAGAGAGIEPATLFEHQPHPKGLPLWPLLFITLSCGAISGFHSTQSPLMARCLRSEKHGRHVFYGAMVVEGAIALIWAAAGMSLYESRSALLADITAGTPALVVSQVCRTLLGPIGGWVAVLGVVVLPVTSGDTAFRSTRLILAEVLQWTQSGIARRLAIALPLFAVAFLISRTDFEVIWRYFGWSNQALASLVLWSAAIYLVRAAKPHWLASLPAAFMTAVVVAFILQADIGFRLPALPANIAGAACALGALALVIRAGRRPAPSR